MSHQSQAGELRNEIFTFNSEGTKKIGKHKASCMGIQKWHVRNYFQEVLERFGGFQFAHAGFYEVNHK